VQTYRSNPHRALKESLRQNAPSPAVTFYDGAERIELSYKSLDNWVAKTANFLVDEIGVSKSEAIYLDLPAHWLKVVWMLAVWASGCELARSRDGAHCVVSSSPMEGDDIYCSLQVMGKLPTAPRGFIDFVTEVRRFGDAFSSSEPPTQIDYPDRWRVPELSRILIAGTDFAPEQIAAAMDAHSSMIILRHASDELKIAVVRDEKITCTWIDQ